MEKSRRGVEMGLAGIPDDNTEPKFHKPAARPAQPRRLSQLPNPPPLHPNHPGKLVNCQKESSWRKVNKMPAASGRPHSIHPRCPTDDDPYLHPHALPFMERVGPALIMTIPPMLSLFMGWFLNSIKSACVTDRNSDGGASILRRLSAGLLLGVVCTEIVPVMVLELHNDPMHYLLAPCLGVIVSIIVVRSVDLFSVPTHGPKHKLSLHLESTMTTPLILGGSASPAPGGMHGLDLQNHVEKKPKFVEDTGNDMHVPISRATSIVGGNWDASIGPALKLLVNCVLDGLVLGTSLVENFDSTGWSLSAAVTIETCVLGMSFTAGATRSTTQQKFCLNLIIASGFPIGVVLGLLLTREFQFNTFFFLSVMGFTTGILVDIVLEDLMREVYLLETTHKHPKSHLHRLVTESLKTMAFYIGFMWCLFSETQLD